MTKEQSDNNYGYAKGDALQTLQSIQSWICAMDAKASYAITIVSVLIGFLLSNNDSSLNLKLALKSFNEEKFNWSTLILILLYLISFFTIICFLQVLVARTKNKTNKKSGIFFGTIAKMDLIGYKNSVKNMSQSELFDDLLEQIYINSQICNRKTKWYNWGQKLLITTTIGLLVAIFKL